MNRIEQIICAGNVEHLKNASFDHYQQVVSTACHAKVPLQKMVQTICGATVETVEKLLDFEEWIPVPDGIESEHFKGILDSCWMYRIELQYTNGEPYHCFNLIKLNAEYYIIQSFAAIYTPWIEKIDIDEFVRDFAALVKGDMTKLDKLFHVKTTKFIIFDYIILMPTRPIDTERLLTL